MYTPSLRVQKTPELEDAGIYIDDAGLVFFSRV